MKVLVIGRTLPSKSDPVSGIFEFEQAKGLHEKNYDVVYGFVDNRSIKVMRSVKKTNSIVDDIQVIGYYLPIGGIPKIVYDKIKYILFKKLYNQTIKHYGKPDIIHVHFPIINLNSKIVGFVKKQNIKIVATEHWSKVQKKELTNREKEILKSLFTNAKKIIAVSKSLSGALQEYNQELNYTYNNNISVIPNVIDESYRYSSLKKDEFFTFVTIGRLIKTKGNDLVIKAFADVVKVRPKVKLIIVGDGPEKQTLENLINEYNLNEKVFLTGFKTFDEIKGMYGKINAYITGSIMETFGVPAVEAWLIGRPVIVGNNHPMKDWVNKSNGLVYSFDKDKTSKNIAKKMIEIQSLEYNYHLISIKCENIFSKDNVLNKLEEVYNNL